MELVSELNKLTIIFHAAGNPAKARGFRVNYSFEEVTCGGVYTKNEGLFRKVFGAGTGTICKYIFEAPEGWSIHLSFTLANLIHTENTVRILVNSPGEEAHSLKR